jgi:excinuclease ABC subunit B
VPGQKRRRARLVEDAGLEEMPQDELARLITTLEEEMSDAAGGLEFEYAARLRDEIADLRRELREVG